MRISAARLWWCWAYCSASAIGSGRGSSSRGGSARGRGGFGRGRGQRAGQRLGHQADGTMLGPGGALGGGGVGLGLLAGGLQPEQQAERALGLARHADGLGAALRGALGGDRGVVGAAHAVAGVEVAGDELAGEGGFGGVGRQQGGDLRDGGVVAAGDLLLGVGDRGRQRGVEVADQEVIGVPGEDEAEVGLLGGEIGVHGGSIALAWIAVKRYYVYLAGLCRRGSKQAISTADARGCTRMASVTLGDAASRKVGRPRLETKHVVHGLAAGTGPSACSACICLHLR